MLVSIIAGFITGVVCTYIGYRNAKKYFQIELIELIEGLPEDVQNKVLAAMNKDIEKSK